MDWWNDQIFLLEPAYEIRCVSSLFVISSDCHGYWTFMLWFVSLDCSFSWLERKEVPKACLVYCCLINHCHNSIATPMHPIVSHRSSSQLYKWYGFYRQTSAQRRSDGLCFSGAIRRGPMRHVSDPGSSTSALAVQSVITAWTCSSVLDKDSVLMLKGSKAILG